MSTDISKITKLTWLDTNKDDIVFEVGSVFRIRSEIEYIVILQNILKGREGKEFNIIDEWNEYEMKFHLEERGIGYRKWSEVKWCDKMCVFLSFAKERYNVKFKYEYDTYKDTEVSHYLILEDYDIKEKK